ncbi:uncharacterized protein LOC120077353 [Benincasa hispida]|uniref:uncharacterized protein LOC120077353 n=1 Tax=Benincasa hispida TaxID=102211 RepID=UPI0019026CC4|nr:uncharacterized protein LOC120077353 [Benincasa hispida]
MKALSSTAFDGSTRPVNVELWLIQLEKCFQAAGYLEDHKVKLVVFLLQNRVEQWWRVMDSRRNRLEEMSWDKFKRIFKDKYYPVLYCEAKMNEFLKLVQGIMTVAEYEQNYTELSRYACTIITEEKNRCRSFESFFRRAIRTSVTTTANWIHFLQLVEIAMRVDESLMEDR